MSGINMGRFSTYRRFSSFFLWIILRSRVVRFDILTGYLIQDVEELF